MKLEFLETGSPDCPLIRLYEFGQSEVQNFRQIAKDLSDGLRTIIRLDNERWIEPVRGCGLGLELGAKDEGVRRSGASTFNCILSAGGWSNVEELIQPFCEAGATGFQWLSRDSKISLLMSCDGRW